MQEKCLEAQNFRTCEARKFEGTLNGQAVSALLNPVQFSLLLKVYKTAQFQLKQKKERCVQKVQKSKLHSNDEQQCRKIV